MTMRPMAHRWFGSSSRTTFSKKFSICGAQGAHNALQQASCPGAGLLLANQFLPIGRSVAYDIASLPGQVGQASGQGLMAAQAARCQNVVDFIGKAVHLCFHQSTDRAHQILQTLSPVGFVEPIDADL